MHMHVCMCAFRIHAIAPSMYRSTYLSTQAELIRNQAQQELSLSPHPPSAPAPEPLLAPVLPLPAADAQGAHMTAATYYIWLLLCIDC